MKKKISLSCVFAVLFLVLIVLVRTVDVAAIGPVGTEVGLSHLNQAFAELTGVNMGWYELTEVFGDIAIFTALFFVGVGICELLRRRDFKKVDKELYALGLLYLAVGVLYILFEFVIVNRRPILMDGETFPEASFPSTHTMIICTVMGSTIMVLKKFIKNDKLRLCLQYVCAILLIVTVIGRLVSGVHWFTDILGGILISTALLFLFAAALEKIEEAS